MIKYSTFDGKKIPNNSTFKGNTKIVLLPNPGLLNSVIYINNSFPTMKNKRKKIAIYCELDQNSGLGHLKRMEALYLEFKKLNHDCFFIFNSKKKKILNKYFSNFKILYLI